MLYLFVGPSGSGKTEVSKKLQKRGYKTAISYTTRQKRYENEDNHFFITKKQYDNISNKIAPVCYNNEYYCYDRENLEESDIMIVEPSALDWFADYVDFPYCIIYFDIDINTQISRMAQRGDLPQSIVEKVKTDAIVFKDIKKQLEQFSMAYTIDTTYLTIDEVTDEVLDIMDMLHKKKPFRLLTDLDDVLENLTEIWLSLLNWLQRDNPDFNPKTEKDLDSWNIAEKFPMLSIDEVYEPLNTDLLWKKITPLDGAVEALRKFNSMPGVEVRILTSSHYSSIAPKREFLRTYFPFINWNQLIISSEKQYVDGNVLVDDYEKNLIGGNYKGILFNKPHNEFFNEKPYENIVRAEGWEETTKIIMKMIKDYYQR